MNTIIFIETTKSGSSREAIRAAERLGYFTVLLTGSLKFLDQRKEFTEVHQMIYMNQLTLENIRAEIKMLEQQGRIIKAVISFIDPFASIAAQLSNERCSADISVQAIKIMENKTLTREELRNNPTTPRFRIYNPSDSLQQFLNDNKNEFPFIIKSPISKASRDVYLVNNELELEKGMKKILKLYPTQKILVEDYLIGPQYLVEVLVHKGEINIIAIIQQDITKKERFIVTGYEVKARGDEELYQTLVEVVTFILKDLQVTNAACHLEMRYVDGHWKLIEINPRISGGAMNRMIEEAFGINLVEETIKLFLGLEPNVQRKYENNIYTHYITIGSYGNLLKVTGKNKAATQPGVLEVYIKPRKGSTMTPPISMGHRYGYIIATGNSPEEAKLNAMKAAQNIKFYLEAN
ncbi:MAG TPA: ATP-grasp domain-containing protein [Bacillus bacterium]|nr:ATP-grasp domain-containing protein [Bacillus sp. (in: firmicutes)]